MSGEKIEPTIVAPGAGAVWKSMGETYVCKVPVEATAGAYSVMEEVTPAGGGIPLHMHRETDELL